MTAEPIDWTSPPSEGWTYDQVKDLDLPFEFELVDGAIVVRGMTNLWHDTVRGELGFALRSARRDPYQVNAEQCVLVDPCNVLKPDVVVFDRTGLDFFTLECVPVAAVALAVEVVSHGSRSDDRFRKPGMYAEAGVPFFWRVERGEDDLPVVYEFHLDDETGVYAPAPGVAVHHGKLSTAFPFPVEVDLARVFPR
ncbi:Uma2 family endonuclease [Kitasatospora sp. NPDC049285]|uniref:Uma2 family endonuclease n=1 Tax=Kitasatospora sp. NPDC049285 TaxID=3157096 RepID=UPI003439C5BD